MDKNQSPVDVVPQPSMDGGVYGAVNPSLSQQQSESIADLESPTAIQPVTLDQSNYQPPKTVSSRLRLLGSNKSKAVRVSALMTVGLVLVTALFLGLAGDGANKQANPNLAIPVQDLGFNNQPASSIPSEFQGEEESLLVRGDIIGRGNLRITNDSFVTVIKTLDLTQNQSIELPNASGTICLSSNNCNYVQNGQLDPELNQLRAQDTQFGQQITGLGQTTQSLGQRDNELAGQITNLQTQLGQLANTIPSPVVNTLNNQAGNVVIQGSLNQIVVNTSNGVVTLSTPQALDANANVQFGNLTIGAGGTITANTLTRNGVGNNLNLSADTDGIVFTSGGRTFLLPGSGPASQTICTDGVSCASGGGQAVILSPNVVQTDTSADASIYINDTGGGQLIRLQSLGIDRLVVDNSGNTTISGSLTVGSLGNGPLRASGGLLSVGAIDLGTADVTGTAPVARGGTGATTLGANGVLLGNGTSPISSVGAAGAGLCLVSTAGAPAFQTCPGGVADVNGLTGSVLLQGTANQVSVAVGMGTITFSTPQDINTTSSPTFASLTLSGLGNGVVRASAGTLTTGLVSLTSEVSGTLPVANGGTGLAASPTNGQLLIGNGTNYTLATLTQGAGIAIANGAGSITISNAFGAEVDLGAETAGNYVAGVSGGDGVSVTGSGGEGSTPSIALILQANKGLEVDSNGLSLIDCMIDQVLKYTAGGQWVCATDSDTASTFSLDADAGTPETINSGDTITIAGGNNITTSVGATDTVTINTVNNPNFTTSVTTPLLQSSGALSITPGGAFTAGSTTQTTLLQGSSTTITSSAGNNINLSRGAGGQIQLTGFDCTAFANGGALTTDASGNISCTDDAGDAANGITGTGNTNRIALFTGSNTIADSWLLQNGSTLEIDATRNLSLLGGNFSVVGNGTFSGLLTANGGLTVEAGDTFTFNGDAFTDLTGTGLQISTGSLQTTLGTSVDLASEVDGVLPVANGGTGVSGTPTNGQLLIGNGTGYTLATLTAGAGITINNGSGSIEVVNTLGASIESSEITDLTIVNADIANGTIDLSTKTTGNYVATVTGNAQIAVTGSGANNAAVSLALVADSIGDAQLAFNTGQNLTVTSTPTFASLILGSLSQAGGLQIFDGDSNSGTVQTADLTADRTYTLPNESGVICLDTGNCAGAGGGITGSGTPNRIAKFNGTGTITDSTITDDGTNLSATGNFALQGGGLTLGTGTGSAGSIVLHDNDGTGTETITIAMPNVSASYTLTLPSAVGGMNQCLKAQNGTGTLFWDDCSGGAGGADGVVSVNNLDGALTLQGTTNQITVNDNGTDTITLSLPQDIHTGATPTFLGTILQSGGTNVLADLNATGTGTTATALRIQNSSTGAISTAIDVSDAEIDIAIDIGSNSILSGGQTITSGELNVLDGGIDLGTETNGNYVRSIVAGNGLTGDVNAESADATLAVVSANAGIVVNTDNIELRLAPSADALSVTAASGSGLEIVASGLSLLQGCSDGQILKWNETSDMWMCAADAGGAGVGDDVLVNGADASGANFIDTTATGTVAGVAFSLNTASNPDEISVVISNASDTLAGVITTGAQTFAGAKTFNGQIVAGAGIDLGAQTLQGSTAIINFDNFDVSSSGAVTAVGVNAGAGLLQGTGGFSVTGATSINASGTAATTIGNTTNGGVVTIQSGSTNNIVLNAGGTIELQDTTNITGALNVSGNIAVNTNQFTVNATNGNTLIAGTLQVTGNTTIGASSFLRITGGNTASRPATPAEGTIYYDTTTFQLLVYANGKWKADGSPYVLVAASDSSDAAKASADFVADGNTVAAADGDQVQINAALTAASAAGGKGKVYLLAGTYVVDDSILVPNNTTLAGAGTDSLIELADLDVAENIIEATGSNRTGQVIRDLKLDGRNDLNTAGVQHGIVIQNVGSVSPVRAGALVTGVEFVRIRERNINFINSHNTIVSNNIFTGVSSNGSAVNISGTYNAVSDNVVNTVNVGIVLDGSDYGSVTGNVINGNGGHAIFMSGADNNTITGNVMNGSSNIGLRIATSNSNTITGNILHDNGGSSGVSSADFNNSDFNIFSSNRITDTAGSGHAIALNATSDNNYLVGNTFSGTGATTISDAGTGTIYGGQTNSANQFVIQGTAGVALNDGTVTSTATTFNLLTSTVTTLNVADAASTINFAGGSASTGCTINGTTGALTCTDALAGSNFSGSSSGTNTGDVTLAGEDYLTLTGQQITANDINLATNVTGTLGIANGGTGATTSQGAINAISQLTANGDLLYYDGTNSTRLGRGMDGQCLTSTASTIGWTSCAGSGSGVTLQAAYDNGNTIVTTNARDIDITLADTTTDSNFIIDVASGSTGQFKIQNNGTDTLTINALGTLLTSGNIVTNGSGVLGIGTSTFGTSTKLTVNANSTVNNNAAAQINAGAANQQALIVQGFASQSADLLQLQDSTGAIMGRFTAGGSLVVGSSAPGSRTLYVEQRTGTVGLSINATDGSSDYFTIGNSGGAGLFSVRNGSTNVGSGAGTAQNLNVWGALSVGSVSSSQVVGGALVNIGTIADGNKGVVVRGASATQTANLIELQASSGGVLSSFNATGQLAIGKGTSATAALDVVGGSVFTGIATPAQPGVIVNVGTSGSTTYTYCVTATTATGETACSPTRTTNTGNATLDGTNYNTINWTAVSGASGYRIYRTASGGTPSNVGRIGTVASTIMTFNDTGLSADIYRPVPIGNTTGTVRASQGVSYDSNGYSFTRVFSRTLPTNPGDYVEVFKTQRAISSSTQLRIQVAANGGGSNDAPTKEYIIGVTFNTSNGSIVTPVTSSYQNGFVGTLDYELEQIRDASTGDMTLRLRKTSGTFAGRTLNVRVDGLGANDSPGIIEASGTGTSSININDSGMYFTVNGASSGGVVYGKRGNLTNSMSSTLTSASNAVNTNALLLQNTSGTTFLQADGSNTKLTVSGSVSNVGNIVVTSIAAPAGTPTITNQGTAGSTSYSYVVTSRTRDGYESVVSNTATTATGAATLNSTDFNRITWAHVSGAYDYRIYRTASAGTPSSTGLIGTVLDSSQAFNTTGGVVNLSFDDTGIAAGAAAPTVQTGNLLRVGNATTADNTAQYFIGTDNAARKGLVIQGVASQSADLFEIQSSNGTELVSIAADGVMNTQSIRSYGGFISALHGGPQQVIIGGIGQGAFAGNGGIGFNGGSVGTGRIIGLGANVIGVQNASFSLLGNTSSTVNLSVVGASGQTADLAQFQNSSGQNLIRIDAAGVLVGRNGSGANQTGSALTLAGGQGTGTGVGGNIVFQYAPAGGSGSTPNTLQTACSISGTNGSFSCPGAGTGSERFGAGATAAGANGSTSLGNSASAPGNQSTALGANSVAGSGVNHGSTAVGQGAIASGHEAVAVGKGADATANLTVALGTEATANFQSSIALGYAANTTASNQLVIGSSSGSASIQNVFIGNGVTAATPTGFTLQATGGSGTDVAGANTTIAGGRGTGNAAGGDIIFQTTAGGQGTGTTLRTLTEVARFTSAGQLTFGSSQDTNLYRSAINTLATDDSFSLLGTGSNLTVQGTGTSNFAGNVDVASTLAVGNAATPGSSSLISSLLNSNSVISSVESSLTTPLASGLNIGTSSSILINTVGNYTTDTYASVNTVATPLGNTSNFAGNIVGQLNFIRHEGSGSVSVLQGVDSTIRNVNGNITEKIVGFDGNVGNQNTASNVYGVDIVASNSGTAGGVVGSEFSLINSGVLDFMAGVVVQSSINTGTVSENYGLFIGDQSGVSASLRSYNIFSEGPASQNWFEGRVAVEGSGNGSTSYGALFKNITNSTTAFAIQNSSSSNLLVADTTNMRVSIGGATGTLTGRDLVAADLDVTTSIRIGTDTNGVSFNDTGSTNGASGKFRLSGTARNSKKIQLTAEYAGLILDADGSNNIGTVTSAFDATQREGYYNWSTTQATNQDYDFIVNIPLPSDFDGLDGTAPITINRWTSNTTDGTINATLLDTNGNAVTNWNSCNITPGSANTWTTTAGCNITSGTFAADGVITLRIKMQAPQNGNTRIGNITINYLSKF